jgi:hydrogenase maturation protease
MVDGEPAKTLVLGLGNLMLSDAGAGIEVIHRLRRRRPRPDGFDLVRAGVVNVSLASIIGHYRGLIVVTSQDFAAEPGTIHELRAIEMDAFIDAHPGHDPSLAEILALLRNSDLLPARRVLLMIQPACERVGRGLSQAVEQRLGELAERIVACADVWMQAPLERAADPLPLY